MESFMSCINLKYKLIVVSIKILNFHKFINLILSNLYQIMFGKHYYNIFTRVKTYSCINKTYKLCLVNLFRPFIKIHFKKSRIH